MRIFTTMCLIVFYLFSVSCKILPELDMSEADIVFPARVLVDVRSEPEFLEGSKKNAINIPYNFILDYKDFLSRFEYIDLFCRTGRRSSIATDKLQNILKDSIVFDLGGINN